MRKSKKSESQKEQDKKGKERIQRFEEGNKVVEEPIIKIVNEDDEWEDYTMSSYQKKDGGDWQKIEISYRRKKKR